mmetsp:Transcript_37818/g.78794  ORF Transcript_37818/g.78794 Transcript_37818/m.78794 type:complete len:139 (-) Transcript_37818:426-842(-)
MKLAYLDSSLETSSSCVPCSTTWPLSKTRIFVDRTTVDRRCAMMKVVLPLISSSRACCTMCSFSLSKALVASSKTSILGFRMIARAMATRCFCPPDIRAARSPGWVSYPLCRSVMNLCALARRAAASISSLGAPLALP